MAAVRLVMAAELCRLADQQGEVTRETLRARAAWLAQELPAEHITGDRGRGALRVSSMGSSVDVSDPPTEKAISRAIGEELRRARETCGWSRPQLAARVPSRISDRTLQSYENGTRQPTAIRLIEICYAMGVDMPSLMRRALQRARIHLQNMAIQIDLYALMNDRNDTFRPMAQWACNSLNEHPDGVVEVAPAVVRNLALFVGCPYRDLVDYLARFIPDYD